jgi:hypothetical protein
VNVAPVTDTPTLTVSTTSNSDSIPSSSTAGLGDGLVVNYYDNVSTLNTSNAQGSNLESALSTESASSTSVVRTVDYYNETLSGGEQTSVGVDDAVSVTGLIYLEAGHTYTFSGYEDDTFRLEIGGTVLESIDFNTYGNYTTTGYTPTVGGYYTIEAYIYDGHGAGALDINVSIDGGTAQTLSGLSLFTSISDVADSGLSYTDFVNVNGSDGGYYPVGINAGIAGNNIALSSIHASLNDTDGSETLSVSISGFKTGFVFSDGTADHTITISSDDQVVTITDWNMSSLTVTTTSNVSGTLELTVTATATETASGSSASTTALIDVAVSAQATDAFNDNVITNAGSSTSFTIPEWALLYNDTSADNLSGTSSVSSLSLSTTSDDITLQDSGGSGGSFSYTASTTITDLSTGSTSTSTDTATVSISRDTSGSLDGSSSNDILIDTNTSTTTIYGNDGNDILIGGVGADSLYGGNGNDVLVYDSADTVVDGGTGTDSLIFTSNATIDLSNIASIASNIEVLDLTQAAVNITNININDVISMSDSDNIIKISGGSNDSVTSSAGWTAMNDQSGVDAGYTRYEATATDGTKAYVDLQNTVVHTDFH